MKFKIGGNVMRKVYDIGINDLRTNWMNENKTNKRIYDTWHNM